MRRIAIRLEALSTLLDGAYLVQINVLTNTLFKSASHLPSHHSIHTHSTLTPQSSQASLDVDTKSSS